jgi:hypothetical protein
MCFVHSFLQKMQEFYLPYILDERFSNAQRSSIFPYLAGSYRVAYSYGRFYRVHVVHELKESPCDGRKEEEPLFECFTLDLGMTFRVPLSRIFPLHVKFAELPPAVRHCGLMTKVS